MGILEFWNILALVLVRAVVRSISPSASQSLIRELVPDEELMNAVSLYTIGFNLARVTGPSLGGVLILWIGAGGCFLLYGLSLVISGLGILFIRIPKRKVHRGEGKLLREIREGFHCVWQAQLILNSVTAAYVISIFVGTYQRFLPVFAKEVLNVGPGGLGLLMAAQGLGGILVLSFLTPMVEKWNKETLIFVTATTTPVFLFLFSQSNSLFVSIFLLTLVGATGVAYRTISRVIIQMRVPYGFLGRVMSVFQMDQGMRSVGSMAIGTFISLFGIALGLSLTSVVSLILTSAIFFLFLRSRRNDS